MKFRKISIQGFRAFNAKCEMNLTGDLCLIFGQNSHGKTSLAEGLEFLFCGTTSRRELIARSKQEYCNALRNVHLPNDQEVFVQAEIAFLENNVERAITVKRVLDTDYPAGNAKCSTRLLRETSGGWQEFRFSEIGLPDFEAPESTPIIFQHTLRYVSNAEPSERRNYFRRLLDVDDLYRYRNIVRDVRDAFQLTCTDEARRDVLNKAESLVAEDDFSALAATIHASPPPTSDSLLISLSNTMTTLLTDNGAPPPASASAEDVAALFKNSITERRARRFDTRILLLPPLPGGWVSDDQWSTRVKPVLEAVAKAHSKYETDNAVIDEQMNALKEFLQAGVNLLDFREPFTGAKECPFCETTDAVTHQRITELRDALAKPQRIQAVRDELTRQLNQLEQLITGIGEAARDQISEALARLQIEDVQGFISQELQTHFSDWWTKLCHVRKCRWRLLRILRLAVRGLRTLQQNAKTGKAVSISSFSHYKSSLQTEATAFHEAVRAYTAATPEMQDTINKAIDALDKRAQWAQLAALFDKRDALQQALVEARARRKTKSDLDGAYNQISEAVGKVLVDDKYPALSGLVSRWWSVLRPSEPVNFKEIKPQGTGQRHIDIKATISGASGTADIERDAVAIFSDSQLNCLGLATFLARSTQDSFGILIFDDPIQSLDKEHEYLFVSQVVDQMLQAGEQVLIFTHNKSFWTNLQIRHAAVLPKGFKVEMVSGPTVAATIQDMDSELSDLLKRIDLIVRNPDPNVALSAANQIRSAAELFCKLLICKAESTPAGILLPSSFDGRMLPDLLRRAEPHLKKDASHSGKIRHIEKCTDCGSHHDYGSDPRNALGAMLGDVRALSKEYGLI